MANEEKRLVEIENLRKYFPIKGTNGPGSSFKSLSTN